MPKLPAVESVRVEVAVCVSVAEKYASWPVVPLSAEGKHVLLMAKHPPVRFQPTSEVEVALPVMVRPESVVVPKPVPETVRNFVAFDVEAISNKGPVWVV